MSWSIAFNCLADFDDERPVYGTLPGEEHRDQYITAREAAHLILDSGACGRMSFDYVITLTGHANPEHRPREGYANDCISVNIYQKSPESPVAAETPITEPTAEPTSEAA